MGLTTFAALTFWSNPSEKSEKTVVNQSPLGKPDGVVVPNPHIQQTPSQNQQQSVPTQNVNQDATATEPVTAETIVSVENNQQGISALVTNATNANDSVSAVEAQPEQNVPVVQPK